MALRSHLRSYKPFCSRQCHSRPVAGSPRLACQAARQLESSLAGDLLLGYTSAGSTLFEVIEGWKDGQATLSWKGQLLQLHPAGPEGTGYVLDRTGGYPAAESTLAAACPKLRAVLPNLHQHGGEPPMSLTAGEVVTSLQELREQVKANPAFWCDGLAPGDPPRSEMQQLLSTAGEIIALLDGQRGVCIVQLYNGWDPSKGQPLHDPFIITLLEQALQAPGVKCAVSEAPGGVGLSAVLYADKEPYNAWGPHLCSFGCQANAVAGSTYYKLLIGRLLGYKPANVVGYAEAMGGVVTPQTLRQVEADMKKLSKVKPKIPWSTVTNSRGKKKAAATPVKKR